MSKLKMNVSLSLETISPGYAFRVLEDSQKIEALDIGYRQRKRSQSVVDKYAHEMREERWASPMLEPIHLAEVNGKEVVLNGQHRLAACVKSKKPLRGIVVRDVPLSYFKFFDGGNNARDLTDIYFIHNASDPQGFATCGRTLFREDVTGDATVKPSASENLTDAGIFERINEVYNGRLEAAWDRYSKLLNSIQRTKTLNGTKMPGLGPKGLFLYFAVRALPLDQQKLDGVLAWLADCDQFPLDAPDKNWSAFVNVSRALRAEAEGDEGKIVKGRHKDFSDTMLTALCLAWNRSRSAERAYTPTTLMAAVRKAESCPKLV